MPWYQQWSVWRRVLAFLLGVVGLVPQFFPLTPTQQAACQFAAAVLALLLTFIPDETVERVTGLAV